MFKVTAVADRTPTGRYATVRVDSDHAVVTVPEVSEHALRIAAASLLEVADEIELRRRDKR